MGKFKENQSISYQSSYGGGRFSLKYCAAEIASVKRAVKTNIHYFSKMKMLNRAPAAEQKRVHVLTGGLVSMQPGDVA